MTKLPALNNTFSINQAAQAVGVHPKTLRRWEQAGKFIPQRTLGNQRRFSQTDLNKLKAIKSGQITPTITDKLLTIEQTAQKLHVSPTTIRRWTREKKLKLTVNNQLDQGYSEKAINQLSKPKSVPTHSSLPPTTDSPQPPKAQKTYQKWTKHIILPAFLACLLQCLFSN